MLGPKIIALEARIANGTAPKWAIDLEPEYLKVIKELGNAAVHADDADVAKHAALDNQLVTSIEEAIGGLLFMIYEVAAIRDANLARMKAAASTMKK